MLSEVEEEQDSSGRESEEGPLIFPDFEYEVTLTPLIFPKFDQISKVQLSIHGFFPYDVQDQVKSLAFTTITHNTGKSVCI